MAFSSSSSSSPNRRPPMSLFDAKNAMQKHMLTDSNSLSALRGIMNRLQKQRTEYGHEVDQLRATGRTCSTLEENYVRYLQEKIKKLDLMMDQFLSAFYYLRDFISHAEQWQGDIEPVEDL